MVPLRACPKSLPKKKARLDALSNNARSQESKKGSRRSGLNIVVGVIPPSKDSEQYARFIN
jgi:hypothetical protein